MDKLSTIDLFKEWRSKLCEYCRNRFEEENAERYLCDILKQKNMSFNKYIILFLQKKNKSNMEKVSFIDIVKKNLSYSS